MGGEGRTASQVRQSGRLNERSLGFFLDSVLIPVCRVDRRRDGRAGHSGPPSGASPSWLCSPKILAPTRSTLRLRSLSAGPCGLPPPCSQGRRFPPEPTLRSDPGSPQALNARVQPCHPALTPTSLTLSICSPARFPTVSLETLHPGLAECEPSQALSPSEWERRGPHQPLTRWALETSRHITVRKVFTGPQGSRRGLGSSGQRCHVPDSLETP